MPSKSNGSQPQSHSNEIEHRLTVVEVKTDGHSGRISYLERAVQGLLYATAMLAMSKSDSIVETLIKASAK